MTEPIRLVCPDCDTVHRVQRITMGKLYRCKKCRANLVTFTPASLVCNTCGTESGQSHLDVSRIAHCSACPDHPVLSVQFPEPPEVPNTTISQAVGNIVAPPLTVPGDQKMLDEILTALTHVRELAASREDLAPLLEAIPVIMSYQESIASVSARSEQIQNALRHLPTSNESNQQLKEITSSLRQLSTQAKQQGLDQFSGRLEGVAQAIAETREEQATKSVLNDLSRELKISVDQLAALGDAQEKRLSTILLTRLGELESRLDTLSLDPVSAKTDKILAALTQISNKPHDPRIDELLGQTAKVIESISGTVEPDSRIDELAKTSGEILEVIKQPLPVKADSRIDMLLAHTTELRQILDSPSDLPQLDKLSSMLEDLSQQVTVRSDVSALADQLTRLTESIPADNSEKIIEQTASLTGQIEKTVREAISACLDKVALGAAEKESLLSRSILDALEGSLEKHHQGIAGQLRDAGRQQSEELNETLSLTLSDKLDLVLATLSRQPIQSESDPHFEQMAQELVARLEPHLENISTGVQPEETTRGFALLREELLKLRSGLQPEDLERLESQIKEIAVREQPDDLAERIGQRVSEEIGKEVGMKLAAVIEQQLGDLPARLEIGIIEPLATKLMERAPEIVAEAQDDKFAKQVEIAAREIQEPLLEEIGRAGQSMPAWLALVFAIPIAFALGFVILKPDDPSRKDYSRNLQSIELQLEQIKRTAANNASAATAAKERLSSLQERYEHATRTNSQLKDLIGQHVKSASDLDKRAKKLELKLRQLGYDPDIQK